MFYKGFLVCTLGLILLSCTNRLEVVSIDEIEIIRTSRDSSYFKDGSIFTGQIIKIVDDKKLLSFCVPSSFVCGCDVVVFLHSFIS